MTDNEKNIQAIAEAGEIEHTEATLIQQAMSLLGKRSASKLTAEQLSDRNRKAANARWKKYRELQANKD